jgi:enediyne biosynthesis thioesterase
MPAYEMRHVVAFEETNLLGNVYYVQLVRWQGRCRELFLRDHAPGVLDDIAKGLVVATTRCSCEYLQELLPFDEVRVRMTFGGAVQNRLAMRFDYRIVRGGEERSAARGEQEVAFLQRVEGRLVPTPVPDTLLRAARAYVEDAPV